MLALIDFALPFAIFSTRNTDDFLKGKFVYLISFFMGFCGIGVFAILKVDGIFPHVANKARERALGLWLHRIEFK